MNALIVILAVATISYQLWVHFVAVMHLKHMRDEGKLTTAQKVIGYPVLAVGLVLDIALQIIISAMFLELPRELTVSGRCARDARSHPARQGKNAALTDRGGDHAGRG